MECITNDAMIPSFFACSGSEAFCGETTDEAKGVEEEFSAESFGAILWRWSDMARERITHTHTHTHTHTLEKPQRARCKTSVRLIR